MKFFIPLATTYLLSSSMVVANYQKTPENPGSSIEIPRQTTALETPPHWSDHLIDAFNIHEYEAQLTEFFLRLKGYVTSRGFKSANFENDTSSLMAEYYEIDRAFRPQPSIGELYSKYIFVRNLFRSMLNSAVFLGYLRDVDTSGIRLLCKTVELIPRTWLLFDYRDEIFPHEGEREEHASSILQRASFLERRFYNLGGVPTSVQRSFRVHMEQVVALLKTFFQRGTEMD